MEIVLKLYEALDDPGDSVPPLAGFPNYCLTSLYVLARTQSFAARRLTQVVGRTVTVNEVFLSPGDECSELLIASRILSRQNEVIVIGHHAHQSRAIVRVMPGRNRGEIIGYWRKENGQKTMYSSTVTARIG